MSKLQDAIKILNEGVTTGSGDIESCYYQLLSGDTFALTTVRRDPVGNRIQEHKVLVQGSESAMLTYIERKLNPSSVKSSAPAAPEVGAVKDAD